MNKTAWSAHEGYWGALNYVSENQPELNAIECLWAVSSPSSIRSKTTLGRDP